MVEYSYNSWGEQTGCAGTLSTTLGVLNPFRYRGYVYDEETGLYYLQSRYYDPDLCRFISADVCLSTGQGVLGCNAFIYCRNDAIMRTDANGFDDYIYISNTDYYVEENDEDDKYYVEMNGIRCEANSLETATLYEWNALELDFINTTFKDLLEEAEEKDTDFSRILNQSIGGELDFKTKLDKNTLYSADGILYNRNEIGNFVWAYFLYSKGYGSIISGVLAQAGSIFGSSRHEVWDMKARHAGISFYLKNNIWRAINES